MLDSGIRAFSRRRDILRRMVYVINFLSAVAAYGGHLAAKVLDRPERLRALTIVWALAVLGVLLSGVQLLILGLVGEYLGRLYLTANKRPQSTVRSVLHSHSSLAAPGASALRGALHRSGAQSA